MTTLVEHSFALDVVDPSGILFGKHFLVTTSHFEQQGIIDLTKSLIYSKLDFYEVNENSPKMGKWAKTAVKPDIWQWVVHEVKNHLEPLFGTSLEV